MAKVIRRPGRFLQDKRQRCLAEIVVCVVLATVLMLVVHPFLGLAWLALMTWPIQRYGRYAKGEAGERIVSQALEALGDAYYIVHDAQIPGANIDHVVLGPNGIFVLETKHHAGVIRYQGDRWWQTRDPWAPGFQIRSPSVQVKRNATLVRERIRIFEQSILKDYPRIGWVHGVVVFANPSAVLDLRSPTVPVVYMRELVGGILATQAPVSLPAPALTKIGLALLGMKGG